MKPTIDIAENHLKEIALQLNTLLADEYVLYTKTRNAHWNVQGPNFMELHKLFQIQYELIDGTIDDVAERVRSLGHFALGSMKDFMAVARLSEHNHEFSDELHILKTLLEDHESIIRILRKEIPGVSDAQKDIGTADFMTGLLEQHEKMAWMLRAQIV